MNITLAIPAATAEIPVKPKIPAIIAIAIQTKNHFNITQIFKGWNNKSCNIVTEFMNLRII